jgi:hypothetical protein
MSGSASTLWHSLIGMLLRGLTLAALDPVISSPGPANRRRVVKRSLRCSTAGKAVGRLGARVTARRSTRAVAATVAALIGASLLAGPIVVSDAANTGVKAASTLTAVSPLAALPASAKSPASASTAATTAATVDPASCANPIVCENELPGTPKSVWDITSAETSNIDGFADPFSVNIGDSINFKIATSASSYNIDIYRMGYYGGDGARLITSLTPNISVSQNQPACNTNTTTGLVDCGNWGVSATWAVPTTAVSGVYFARI